MTTEEKMAPDDGSKDCSDVATNQGMWRPLEARRGRNEFSQGTFRRGQPCSHLDLRSARLLSDFWPPEL